MHLGPVDNLIRLWTAAFRIALREAAAPRRVRSSIRAEVRKLAADPNDRQERRLLREQLAELAPPPLPE